MIKRGSRFVGQGSYAMVRRSGFSFARVRVLWFLFHGLRVRVRRSGYMFHCSCIMICV